MPDMAFSPSTMMSRRRRNSSTIEATSFWGPFNASMPAICENELVHDVLFTWSLATSFASSSGIIPYPRRPDRAFPHPGKGRDAECGGPVVEDPVIVLIRQHDEIVLLGKVRNRADAGLVQYSARRIVRRIQNEHPRPGRDQLPQVLRVERESLLFPEAERNSLRAHKLDRRFVDREPGVGINHFVALVDARKNCEEHDGFCAGGDNDLLGLDLDAARRRDMPGNRRSRLGKARSGAVVRETVVKRLLRRLLDIERSIEIGLPDLEMDDVFALRLEGAGFREDLERRLGPEAAHPLCDVDHRLLCLFNLCVDENLLAALLGEGAGQLYFLSNIGEELFVRARHPGFGDDEVDLVGFLIENAHRDAALDAVDCALLVVFSHPPLHSGDVTLDVDNLSGHADFLRTLLILLILCRNGDGGGEKQKQSNGADSLHCGLLLECWSLCVEYTKNKPLPPSPIFNPYFANPALVEWYSSW